MILFVHPRRWAAAAALALVAVAAWLLLVPLTAIYVSDVNHPAPRELVSRYSWQTTEQNLLYSDASPTTPAHPVNGVRLNCGNAFTSGSNVTKHIPDGPQACGHIKAPRAIVALILIALAAATPLVLRALPVTAGQSTNRYKQPAVQRRALRKSRR